MSYALRMSEEIRAWLADLRDGDPRSAMLVGQALTALIEEGGRLGPPLVSSLAAPPQPDELREALDLGYERRLERLRELRRVSAEAAAQGRQPPSQVAEHDALLAEADAYRARKEVLKARYLAAEAMLEIDESDAAAAERLADVAAQMRREVGDAFAAQGRLLELSPGAPDDGDVSIMFAVEPTGTALLISVLQGSGMTRSQHEHAVAVSARVLRRVRSGQDPEASACAFDDARSFLDEFFPGRADEVQAGAAALAAKNRAHGQLPATGIGPP